MALINCTECGKQVSSKAAACPHCGAPVMSTLAKDIASAQKAKKWVGYFLAIPVLLGSGWLQLLASNLNIEIPLYGFGNAKSFGEVVLLTAPLTLGVAVMVLALLRGWLESAYSTIITGALVLAGTSYIATHFIPWFGLDPNLLPLAAERAGIADWGDYFSIAGLAMFIVWMLFGYWQDFGWWYFVSSLVVGSYIGWWLHKDILRRWLDSEL